MRAAEAREEPVGSGYGDIEAELQIHHLANRIEKRRNHQGTQRFAEEDG